MALGKLWTIAYRDLGRNRRRSMFTLLAVAVGLALLIAINGLISGVIADTVENNIRLKTGHVQLRAGSYEEQKLSLQWEDLIENGEELAAHRALCRRLRPLRRFCGRWASSTQWKTQPTCKSMASMLPPTSMRPCAMGWWRASGCRPATAAASCWAGGWRRAWACKQAGTSA